MPQETICFYGLVLRIFSKNVLFHLHFVKNGTSLLFHFCFNFILLGHLGHVNFSFNWCSVFTESCFSLWKRFQSSKSVLLRFPLPGKYPPPSKISNPPPNWGGGIHLPTPYDYLQNPGGICCQSIMRSKTLRLKVMSCHNEPYQQKGW